MIKSSKLHKKPKLQLGQDPRNNLNLSRAECEVNRDTLAKFFFCFDIFDFLKAQKDFERVKQFIKIIEDNPDIFTNTSNEELSVEQQRLAVNEQLLFYINETKKIEKLGECMTDITRFIKLVGPIHFFRHEVSVKLIVNL